MSADGYFRHGRNLLSSDSFDLSEEGEEGEEGEEVGLLGAQ